jgi:ferritin-like protein
VELGAGNFRKSVMAASGDADFFGRPALRNYPGMPMSSESLHEDAATIGPLVVDRHRAITSLMEELEAVDWYDQRAAATKDEELRAILIHNRDEEKEHACMALEWLRRRDAVLDAHLRKYLFTNGPIGTREAEEEAKAAPQAAGDPGLAIGSLRFAAEG